MKGSIHQKPNGQWYVAWYHQGKQYKVYRYAGEPIESRRVAEKLRSAMQQDAEKGMFRIETYTIDRWTDTVAYLHEWLEHIAPSISRGTLQAYRSSIKIHLEPFFRQHQIKLAEIQYDVLVMLLNSINRTGAGKMQTMKCLQSCLKHAWKSRRIPNMPPFPDRRMYQIVEPEIKWIPEDRQLAIIAEIPKHHQPIFLWMKYHMRRPAEAMSLLKTDYDPLSKAFTIHRSVSGKQHAERTKTGKVHHIPCHSEFEPFVRDCQRPFSPFFFSCAESRQVGQSYTNYMLNKIWHTACSKAGETIPLYAGCKHSSCSQYINERGLSLHDLQAITDHGSIESVKRYAHVELARKRELMERGRVIPLRKVENE